MDRRAFVTGLGTLLAALLVAEAQRAVTTSRIGYVTADGYEAARRSMCERHVRTTDKEA